MICATRRSCWLIRLARLCLAGGAGWFGCEACAGSDTSAPARPKQREGIPYREGLPPIFGGQVHAKG